jgi:hypothetical protein
MRVAIINNGDCFDVWVSLELKEDPRRLRDSFVIGTGETRDAAVASAVQDLEAALDALQGPPGVVAEYD